MSTVTIQTSELRGKNAEKIEDLVEFLKDRVNAKIDVASNEITINYEEVKERPPKTYVRVLLRKFLHKAELKEQFRVISGKENVFIIKERKSVEE
ncbi:MAG: 60S ribosomal protein L22 [Candidatus Bathyarchaeota archaeon]|jgi:DNA-binding protein